MEMRSQLIAILFIGTIILSGCAFPNGGSDSLTYDIACSSDELVAALRKINEVNPDQTITLNLEPNCEYVFDNPSTGDDGVSTLPTISTSIFIEGNQATLKLLKEGYNSPPLRIIHVSETGDLFLTDLTITTEDPTNSPYIFRDLSEKGGVVFNDGDLKLNLVTFLNNFAQMGGAIFNNNGSITIADSIFEGNRAATDGGAIYSRGDIQILNSTFSENSVKGGYGGAIFQIDSHHNKCALSVTASTFSANKAGNSGNGGGAIGQIGGSLSIFASTFDSNQHMYNDLLLQNTPINSGGGAIVLIGVDFTATNSEFNNNSTNGMGGAISLSEKGMVFERVAGELNFSEAFADCINPNSGALIENCTFTNNQAVQSSGAIYDYRGQLIIRSSTFSNNFSEHNEGLIYQGGGQLTLDHCSITENRSLDNGYLISKNNWGNMLLESSLIAQNDTQLGVLYTDNISDFYTTEINNCTISQNTGALIHTGPTLINASTIVQNSSAGIIFDPFEGAPILTIQNSIVANNSGGDCDFEGNVFVSGVNLSSDGSCTGFTLIADPLLEGLADNGGPTLTHALQAASPALNAASSLCLSVDQRGETRPDTNCDLGAYEAPLVVVSPESTPTPDTNYRCSLFDPKKISLAILDIPFGSTTQTLYITIPDGVPGLEYEISEDSQIWEYYATLGGFDEEYCNMQGYDGRLYCAFNLPDSVLGNSLELFVYVNYCETPIYSHPGVSVLRPTVPTQAGPSIVCTADLGETACISAGGEYKDSSGMIAPYCECP